MSKFNPGFEAFKRQTAEHAARKSKAKNDRAEAVRKVTLEKNGYRGEVIR